MSNMSIVESRTACLISSTALGAVVGAIGTGGNPIGIIVGGAGGYLLGKVVCRIPALERVFDNAFGNGDWALVEQTMLDPVIKAEAIALISTEAKVSEGRASEIWSALADQLQKTPQDSQAKRASLKHAITRRMVNPDMASPFSP